MSEIAWLAALLSPRSVSTHPNFWSTDIVTPFGLLGLAVMGEPHEIDELEGRLDRPLTDAESVLISAATESVRTATIDVGARKLSELANHADTSSLGIRAAATLLACSALAELERAESAVQLIDTVLEKFPVNISEDSQALAACLHQQKAFRLADLGREYELACTKASELIETIELSRLTRYQTSQGSMWPAATTNRHVVAAIRDAIQDLFDAQLGFPNSKTLKRILKTPNSPLVAAMVRHSGNGESAFIDEQFAKFAQGTEKSVRAQDPVDHPVWRASHFFELLGHRRQANFHRRVLGELRLVRSERDPDTTREGLRLLRQSNDSKNLKLALTHVRSAGPIAALADEVESIVKHRLSPTLLREVELSALEAGAQVLSERSARTAFEALVSCLDAVPIRAPFRRELPAIQLENLLKAAAAVAPIAERTSDLAAVILLRAKASIDTDDQLLVRAFLRGLRPLDWDDVNEDTRQEWRDWVSDPALNGTEWTYLVSALTPQLIGPRSLGRELADDFGIDQLASELNALIVAGERQQDSDSKLARVARELLVSALELERANSKIGMYSLGGVEPAELAIVAIQFLGADLWDALISHLLDVNVPRRMKAAALNRIASDPSDTPPWVRESLRRGRDDLLSSKGSVSPFEPADIDPFPSAIRALTALEILSTEQVLSALAILAAGDSEAKREASRLLTALFSGDSHPPQWAVSVALQLSNDADSNVRAETGRTLAIAMERTDFAKAVIESRLLALLSEDGILVPLLVLRGLSSDGSLPPGPIRLAVEGMESSHPVYGIRMQARFALSKSMARP